MPPGRNAVKDAVTPLVHTASQSSSIIFFVFISFSEAKLQRLDALCKPTGDDAGQYLADVVRRREQEEA